MQNFNGIQQNMNDPTHQMNMQMPYGFAQMRTGQEFPVPITSTQNASGPQRKMRNNKKHPAPPSQPQQMRMMQQQNPLQQFQQPPPPPTLQPIDPMGQMGSGSIGQLPQSQMPQPQIPQMPQIPQPQMQIPPQKINKVPPPRPIPQNNKPQPPQQKVDQITFFSLCQTLISFPLMDSIESDWIGENVNPEITKCIKNANDDVTDLDFDSVQDYINASNNLFEQ